MAIAIKKPALIAYLLSLLVAVFICLHDYNRQGTEIVDHVEKVDLKTLSVPSFVHDLPHGDIVGIGELWGVQESTVAPDMSTSGAAKRTEGQFYLKSLGGGKIICSAESGGECWVFYGVFSSPDGLSAIFYNNAAEEEKWRLLREGDHLAGGLRLTGLKPYGAVLTWAGDNQIMHNLQVDIFALNIHDIEPEKVDEKEPGE